jgi:superfamily II DNA or RNA helicase
MQWLQFPNPKYIENQRMGRWNGGVPRLLRFYDKVGEDGLWIPRGFMRQLIVACRDRNLTYHIDDRRRSLPQVDFTFTGRLKDFQRKAVDVMATKEFGTLSAPTGSGKTVMTLNLVFRRRQPSLIIVHTKTLARQWRDRIEKFLGIPSDEIGLIGGGKIKIGRIITVAMVQSLYKCAGDVSPQVGHLIVDECHRTPSRTFTEAVSEFDSRFMLGLSATPFRRDRLSKLIFWHLGDIHHRIGKKELEDRGHILKARIFMRETNFKPYYDPINEYSKMLQELTLDDDRNRLIAADVAAETQKSSGICLVLSDRKRHCETLQSILRYKFHMPARLLTGDLSGPERNRILRDLSAGSIQVLIATGQLIGEGFDCPNLTSLFLATPIRFGGRVVQYLGRVLRPAKGKSHARVYDYVDVNVGPLVAAANARQKVYSA